MDPQKIIPTNPRFRAYTIDELQPLLQNLKNWSCAANLPVELKAAFTSWKENQTYQSLSNSLNVIAGLWRHLLVLSELPVESRPREDCHHCYDLHYYINERAPAYLDHRLAKGFHQLDELEITTKISLAGSMPRTWGQLTWLWLNDQIFEVHPVFANQFLPPSTTESGYIIRLK